MGLLMISWACNNELEGQSSARSWTPSDSQHPPPPPPLGMLNFIQLSTSYPLQALFKKPAGMFQRYLIVDAVAVEGKVGGPPTLGFNHITLIFFFSASPRFCLSLFHMC